MRIVRLPITRLERILYFALLTLYGVLFVPSASAQNKRLPEPLCDYRNVKEEAFREAELDCIKKAGVAVERVGERLTVTKSYRTGLHKEDYTDNRAACDGSSGIDVGYCVYYTFLGYLPEIESVVISKGCYEFCQDVMLVSLTGGGAPIFGEAIPQFSPDRSMFVFVAASDAGDGLRTADIQLFAVVSGKPVPVFSYRAPRDMYEAEVKGKPLMQHSYESWRYLGWSSSNEVELTVGARGAGCHANTEIAIKLQKTTTVAWKLSPGPPCR
jgi:hypothetical protein